LGLSYPSCVVVDWNDEEIFLHFVFDGDFSEDDQKVMAHVAEEVLADFPGGIVKPQFLNIPYPQRFSSLEQVCVYARKEINL